jgi:hypothetical protein
MTKRQGKSGTIDVKALLAEDEEFLQRCPHQCPTCVERYPSPIFATQDIGEAGESAARASERATREHAAVMYE